MNTLKYILLILLLGSFSIFGNAQSSKALELAENRVAEINDLITAVNPDVALTTDQKRQIKALHIKRTEKIQEIKNSDLSDVEKETKIINLRKEFGKTYTREVLTQAQRSAKKEAKTLSANQ